MPSPVAEKAIEDAQQHGRAILKFISANDAGVTGSHQAGFYLPKSAWKMFAPFGPVKGRLDKSDEKLELDGKLTIEIAGMTSDVTLNQTQETTITSSDTPQVKKTP